MTDIVERLRNRIHDSPMDAERLMDEAANEIEQLEKKNIEYCLRNADLHSKIDRLNDLKSETIDQMIAGWNEEDLPTEQRLTDALLRINRLQHNQITASHVTIAQAAALQTQRADAETQRADALQTEIERLRDLNDTLLSENKEAAGLAATLAALAGRTIKLTEALQTSMALLDTMMTEISYLQQGSDTPISLQLLTVKKNFDIAMKKLLANG